MAHCLWHFFLNPRCSHERACHGPQPISNRIVENRIALRRAAVAATLPSSSIMGERAKLPGIFDTRLPNEKTSLCRIDREPQLLKWMGQRSLLCH